MIGFSWGAATASKVFAMIQHLDPDIRVDVVFTIDPVLGNPATSKEFNAIDILVPNGWNVPTVESITPTNFCKWNNYYQKISLIPLFRGDSFPFATPNRQITNDDILNGPYNPQQLIHAKADIHAHALIPFLKEIQNDWEDVLRPFKADPSKESYKSCLPCQHELRRP